MTLQRVWNNFSAPAGPRRWILSWPSCPLWPNTWTTSVGEWGSMWLETTAIWDLMLVYISFFSKLQSSFFTVMIFSVSTATLLWLAIGLNPSALLNRVSTNILMFLTKSLGCWFVMESVVLLLGSFWIVVLFFDQIPRPPYQLSSTLLLYPGHALKCDQECCSPFLHVFWILLHWLLWHWNLHFSFFLGLLCIFANVCFVTLFNIVPSFCFVWHTSSLRLWFSAKASAKYWRLIGVSK